MILGRDTHKTIPAGLLSAQFASSFRRQNGSVMPTTTGTEFVLSQVASTDDVPQVALPQRKDRPVHVNVMVRLTGPSASVPLSDVPITSADANLHVDVEMARWEAAAEKGDDLAFIRAMKQVDWARRNADEYMLAVRLALAAGAFFQARELSAEGAGRFSNHAELQTAAQVLAPPRVIPSREAARPKMGADADWVKKHGAEFRGKWVALQEGNFLGADVDLKSLVNHLGTTEGIFFTRIY